jgi:hypothetical protein
VLAPATRRPVLVHSTSPPPAATRARVAGGAEEPLLARHIRSSKRRRQDAYATSRRRRTHTRSRRLSLRLRDRLCSPSRTPRCRSSSRGEGRPGGLSVVCSRPSFMPRTQLVDHRAAAIIRSTRLLQPWHCASALGGGAEDRPARKQSCGERRTAWSARPRRRHWNCRVAVRPGRKAIVAIRAEKSRSPRSKAAAGAACA